MLAAAPFEGVPQAFFERNDRRVAEQRPGFRDVGLRILHVALTWLLVDRLEVRADDAVQDAEELVERHAPVGGDVDDLAGR